MAQSPHSLRIGTRGSPLALVQARAVRERLAAALSREVESIEVRVIRTTGDRITDRPLADAGGKGLFTKEIEEALIREDIDFAVHSSKDIPAILPAGLTLAAFLAREDPRDAGIVLVDLDRSDDTGAGHVAGRLCRHRTGERYERECDD